MVLIIGILLTLSWATVITQAEVKSEERRTDVGVEFETGYDESSSDSKESVYKPQEKLPSQNILPQTGEVITSLIVMLIGVSLLIFILGVIVLKQFYEEISWEC